MKAKVSSIESTLVKLSAFIKKSVKYSDFTAADKANLVEIFVTHEKTLVHLYSNIFAQSTKVEKKYNNLKVSEKSAIEQRNVSMRLEEGDFLLNEAAIYTELLNGDVDSSLLIKRNSSSSMLDDTIDRS